MRISLADVMRPILIKGPRDPSEAGRAASTAAAEASTVGTSGDFCGTEGLDGEEDGFCLRDSVFWAGGEDMGRAEGALACVLRLPHATEKRTRTIAAKESKCLILELSGLLDLAMRNGSRARTLGEITCCSLRFLLGFVIREDKLSTNLISGKALWQWRERVGFDDGHQCGGVESFASGCCHDAGIGITAFFINIENYSGTAPRVF